MYPTYKVTLFLEIILFCESCIEQETEMALSKHENLKSVKQETLCTVYYTLHREKFSVQTLYTVAVLKCLTNSIESLPL